MGNDDHTAGNTLKYAAGGAAVGAVVGGPVGAAVGGLVGAGLSLFSGGPEAQHLQANVGGESITAYDIYDKISNGRTDSMHTGMTTAGQLQDRHDARASQIDALNKTMSQAWQGSSAESATGGANALKIWHEDSAKNLVKSKDYLGNQIDVFHDTQGKVQKIDKDAPSMSGWDHVNPFSDKDDEIDQYNKNSQVNVQAYQAYYGASGQNASGMPQYNVWQGNQISDPNGPNGPGGTGPFGPGGTGGFTGGPGGTGGTFKPPKYTPPPTTPPGGFTPPPTNPRPPGGFTPPPTHPGPPGGFTPPGDGTTTSGWTPPTTDPSKFSPSSFGPAGGGGGGFGPAGGGGAGAGGGAFGMGGFGPGGSGSGAMAGEAGAGAGGMRGAGAGAGAGAAGKPGSAGMGGMGAGAKGGKGEEDGEHQTKYLLEEDGDGIFGSDEMTVPPVIGE
ncbi:hypothetical protein [Amycolatopsis benzoatilytica]|uniref:hypothetical protein n=1 Tax=Amycolatopsis benzoatilytica TaxID=346045 RepID=UPI00037C2559|nr:hypothetical protein [Amycolatopsis benzoatilytica]